MDLTQLASIGEFIGGTAVLATLVYLAIQVRQGTESQKLTLELARADATLKGVQVWSTFRRMCADEQLSQIWTKALADETLSELEGLRLRAMVEELVYSSIAAYDGNRAVRNFGALEIPALVLVREFGDSKTLRKAWRSVERDLNLYGRSDFADLVSRLLFSESAPPKSD